MRVPKAAITEAPSSGATARRVLDDRYCPSRTTVVAGVAVPVMVAGQFAFLAAVPVAVVAYTVFRHRSTRALRATVGGLIAVYTAPWIIWAGRSHPAQSLSKDMSPVLAAAVVAVGAGAAVVLALTRRNPQFGSPTR